MNCHVCGKVFGAELFGFFGHLHHVCPGCKDALAARAAAARAAAAAARAAARVECARAECARDPKRFQFSPLPVADA